MFSKVLFQYHLLSRTLTIMPRKSKSIRLLYFDHVFSEDRNFVTIKFHFSNAIFHQVGEHKTVSRSITLPVTDGEQVINMAVQGYFRRKEYLLHITREEACLTHIAQPTGINSVENYQQLQSV